MNELTYKDKIRELHCISNIKGELVEYTVQLPEPQVEALLTLMRELTDEVIGEDEKSEHVRRFQCRDYGNGCYDWSEQWKSNQTPPYCSTCGKKMESVEFDQEQGDDWTKNELRATQRKRIEELLR